MSFTLCKPGENVTIEYRDFSSTAGMLVVGDRAFLFHRGYNFVKLSEEERAFIADNLKDMTERFGYQQMTDALQHAILDAIRVVLLMGAERFGYDLHEGELCAVKAHVEGTGP